MTSQLNIITKRKTFCQAAGLFTGVESNLWNIVKYYLTEYNYSKISCRAAAVKGHFLHFIWCIAFKMHFSRQGVVGWRVFTKDLALELHSLYEKVLLHYFYQKASCQKELTIRRSHKKGPPGAKCPKFNSDNKTAQSQVPMKTAFNL